MIRIVQLSWQSVVEDLRSRWIPAGLDLAQPFQVAWYNRAVDDAFRLSDFGRPSALGILVALEPLIPRSEVRWTHDLPPRRVAVQRLAHLSGLAYLSPSHLSAHVTYGPWIALRAAIVIDIKGHRQDGGLDVAVERVALVQPEPIRAQNASRKRGQNARVLPSGPSPGPPNPCLDCEATAYRGSAIAAAGTPAGHAAIERHWQLWLAVRDACPVGRSHRYSDAQIRYHYTKDREVLRRLYGSAGP